MMFKRIRVLCLLGLSMHAPISVAAPETFFTFSPAFFDFYSAYQASLFASTNTSTYGAHSRPLSHLVGENQDTVWVTGDWGRDDHGSRSGNVGLAEINYGHHFGSFQLNGTLGQTWANQSGANNSDLDADGQYLMIEGIFPISKERKVFAVLSALGHKGEADIRRGYVNNLGVSSASNASPDTDTYGLRARLEWQDATEMLGAKLSPYVDLNYTKTHIESYRETGGTGPLKFDARKDDNTTMRVGFNAERPISGSQLNWVGNIELAHSFDSTSANISGQSLFAGPVTNFNVSGGKIHNNWVKAGAGVEGVLGQGKAMLMLNGTTNSGMPNMWVSASYQLLF